LTTALVAQRIEHLTTDDPELSAVLTCMFAAQTRALCLWLSAASLAALGDARATALAPIAVPTTLAMWEQHGVAGTLDDAVGHRVGAGI
jgi:hypothetical protein